MQILRIHILISNQIKKEYVDTPSAWTTWTLSSRFDVEGAQQTRKAMPLLAVCAQNLWFSKMHPLVAIKALEL